MPVQPATNVRWNGNYIFGNEVLISFPELGTLVAATIAGWAMAEANLGRTFAALIGARQPVTMSMYSAARSYDVQRDLLQTAVNEIMPKRYSQLFRAALEVLSRAAHHRHRFAHWIWGASADPDLKALLLIEPKEFWQVAAVQLRYWQHNRTKSRIERVGPVAFAANVPKFPHDRIWVYQLKDLQEARASTERAYRIAEALRQLVQSNSERRRAIYRWIRNEADIKSALSRIQEKR